MTIAQPTAVQLAAWLDIAVGSLDTYEPQAREQATDLLMLATCEEVIWVDTDDTTLRGRTIRNALTAMASALIEGKDSREVAATAIFRRETIGAYTYERFLQNIRQALPTGVQFFDQAVELITEAAECGLPVDSDWSTGTSLFYREDGLNYKDTDGRPHILGPKDVVELTKLSASDPD